MNTKVNVDKLDLLTKLKENRELHALEYKTMHETYILDVIKGLQKMVRNAKKGDIRTSLIISEPHDYTNDYDEIIGMLEMSVDSTFSITADEYKRYVLNIWSWTISNNLMKTTYLGN